MYSGNNGNGKTMKVLALESGKTFAALICRHLNNIIEKEGNGHLQKAELCPAEEVTFANGEKKYVIHESVRGCDVYVVQLADDPTTENTVNDNLLSLAFAVNAAYQSDAHRVTAVIPQFPYARQDKKKGREPISAKIAGRLMEISGAKHAITIDIHSEAIEGFFERLKLQNLHMGRILLEYVRKHISLQRLMVVAPDVGSAKRGVFFAKNLGVNLAIIDKVRDYSKASKISDMRLVGDVQGKNVLICDDMLATGGTVINAARLLKHSGANDVYVGVALPFFSGKAVEKFRKAHGEGILKKVIGTNAVSWGRLLQHDEWYEELDVTGLFAQVIHRLHIGDSVSALLA